jgi:hypothetical protein
VGPAAEDVAVLAEVSRHRCAVALNAVRPVFTGQDVGVVVTFP